MAVGATITLGLRSMFVELDGEPHHARAAAAHDEHAGPGHEGHAHSGAPSAPRDAQPDGGATTGPQHDGHAEGGDVTETAEPAVGLLVDLGNSACPVMENEPDGKTFSEWNGLRVGHCCPGCGKRFRRNPEALLDAVHPKWREAAAAVKAVKEARGAERDAALAQLRAKWRVVREPVPPKAE
jgi:hypothetical protein